MTPAASVAFVRKMLESCENRHRLALRAWPQREATADCLRLASCSHLPMRSLMSELQEISAGIGLVC
jgi:hypothetical protein